MCKWLIKKLKEFAEKLNNPLLSTYEMVGHYEEGTSTCVNKKNQIEEYINKAETVDEFREKYHAGMKEALFTGPKKCCGLFPVMTVRYNDKGDTPGTFIECCRCKRSVWQEKQVGAIETWDFFTPDTVKNPEEKCSNCKFYADFNKCKKRAPVFVSFKYEEKTVYPYVELNEWCGDFRWKKGI